MDAQTKAKFRKMILEDADFAQKVFKDKDLYQAIYGDDPANTIADVSDSWQSDPKYLKDTKGFFTPVLKSLNKEARPLMLGSWMFMALFVVFNILWFMTDTLATKNNSIVFFGLSIASIITAIVLQQLAANKESIPMYRAFKEQWLKQFSNK